MTKRRYVSPSIKKKVEMEMETPILAGSVVNSQTNIETAGQKVENHDFSNSGFNTTWE